MNFSEKVAKIAKPLTYRRAWRRIRRAVHPIRLGPLMRKIDSADLQRLREQHLLGAKNYVPYLRHYVKYLDVERQLKMNIARVQDLNLPRQPPRHVLDIGCGGGFFLFILNQLGHRGLGIDTEEIPLFTGLIDLLGVERRIHEVRAFEPMPNLEQRFDWITSYSTAFHGVEGQSWRWGPPEWEFFLDDLDRLLQPGGRIFFALNPSYHGAFYTPEILDLFLQRGARVERENVLFPPKATA